MENEQNWSCDAILTLLMTLSVWIVPTIAFRGPHHPRSSVLHHHYVPEPSVKLTQNEELLHDATHLAEDMGPLAEHIDISKMSDQELEFHYFKLHDVDNNTKLDGLELLHALQHTLHGAEDEDEEDSKAEEDDTRNEIDHEHPNQHGASIADYSWIVELIDRVLEEDDLDHDGYLGYTEYVLGRKKDQDERARRNINLKV